MKIAPPSARARRAPWLAAALVAALALGSAPAFANHDIVTNPSDAGPGSLRQAVFDALPGDSILFDPGVWGQTITLSSGAIAVGKVLRIVGPQKALLTIASASNDRVFTVAGVGLTLAGLTLRGASPGASQGGLVQASPGTASLVVTDCNLVGGTSPDFGGLIDAAGTTTLLRCRLGRGSAGAGQGGAVYSTGLLQATDCMFDSCAAGTGGAIASAGKLRLVRCSFAGNQAATGAAIEVASGADSASLIECTVAFHSATGVAVHNASALPVDVGNTIVAANAGHDVAGAFHSLGFNAIGAGDGSSGFGGVGTNDLVGTIGAPFPPGIASPADNGGPTLTMLPTTSGAVLDRGHAMAGTVDARGHARTYDYPPVLSPPGSDGTDIGAAEYAGHTVFTVTNLADRGPGSFRQAAITAAPADSVKFDPSVGGTIPLTSGEIFIPRTMVVIGPGPNALIVDGGGVRPCIAVSPGGASVFISGFQLTHAGGAAAFDLGAGSSLTADYFCIVDCHTSGIHSAGALSLLHSLVARCNASAATAFPPNGGGIRTDPGVGIVLTDCTVTADTAQAGGGVYSKGFITLFCSTIVDNVTVGSGAGTRQGGGVWSSGPIYPLSSIIAGNQADQGGPDLMANCSSSGFNLVGIGDGSTGLINGTLGDQVGSLATPLLAKLGALADNGGPTLTLLPLAGSPAIDQGFSPTYTGLVDQRQRARIFDDPAVTNAASGDGSDVGACERGAATVDVAPPGTQGAMVADRIDAVTPNPWTGRCTVTFALARAGNADLALYDVAGRRVAVLARGAMAAGPHALAWSDAATGARLAPGLYWLRLVTAGGAVARQVVRLR